MSEGLLCGRCSENSYILAVTTIESGNQSWACCSTDNQKELTASKHDTDHGEGELGRQVTFCVEQKVVALTIDTVTIHIPPDTAGHQAVYV